MSSKDLTANSSLGILDLADSKLEDCLTDMENLDCSTRFKKTIQRLHKTCNEKLADLTTNFEVDVSKFHLGDQNDPATEGEDVDMSRLDSIFLKPASDLTQSKDATGYSAYQSTPKEKSQKSFSTNSYPLSMKSFGRKVTAAVGNESELSSIPNESFSAFKSNLRNDELSSRKESKLLQERSIENWQKASSAEHDIAEASFRKEQFCGRSFSQESFTALRKKFELNSDGSSSGGTLKLQTSPPVRRSLSLDDANPFEFERRNTGFSALSINSSMFRTGVDAINAIDEDEKEFREENRFEISRISDISTIPPDFSHVSDPASGDYFFARSEKVGGLSQKEDAKRPSLGLQIVSPPANPLGKEVPRPEPEASLFGEMSQTSAQLRQPITSTATASTVQGRFSESSASSASTVTRSLTREQPSTESGYQSSQQPLHVYVPMQDRISPCCHSGPNVFQYPPVHPWAEQGPYSYPAPFYQNSVCRGPYPNMPSVYNHPNTAQDFFKIVVQAVLPEQLVCVHDVKEVGLAIHNPSYQTLRCHARVLHVTVLDSVAVKVDAMANSEFTMPGTLEVRGGTTHNLKFKCSFKLPGKYRVHLEVVSESLQAAASYSSCAFTVEVEEPNVEMSNVDGGNCIDFGRIVPNSSLAPQYIRLVNKTRASVPVKISINSMCDMPKTFQFPLEMLQQLVASTSHAWVDVFPTFLVLCLDGHSTLDIPVTADTSHQSIARQGENFVASIQLSLKGNIYRTKHLMKICAILCSSTLAARSTVTAQRPSMPSVFSQRADDTEERSRLSKHTISYLATRKRSLYFPGVEVGQAIEKTIPLMNKSDIKLIAQLIIISSSPQPQYFIKDGDNEYSRLQNIVFEPQQKRGFTIVFRPTSVLSSSCSLEVKACTAARRMDKQNFLVPICGYGGASQLTMIRPHPNSSGKAHLLVSPLNKGKSDHFVRLRNSGSRAAFVAILPLKDGQIELDNRVSVSNQAFVIPPGETTEVKVTVTFPSFDSSIFTFSQYLSFLYGDEQLRKILKNKISSCDTSDRRLYEGPGLMKTLNILQPFLGEEAVPQDELYQEFKKEVAELFYETIKVYDVVLSTNVDVSNDEDSFFSISNLACSYGSILNSTVFNRDNTQVAYGMSPPIRDLPKTKK